MKKAAIILSAALVLSVLAACGGAAPVRGSAADYAQTVKNSRDPELNDVTMYNVVTGPADALHDAFFGPAFGFVEADMEKYAVSLSGVITVAYGIAIILPAEGRDQAVLDQANGYVEQQRAAQENYLPAQYEIAQNAIVKQVKTGEVVMVMCRESEDVAARIEAALEAG